MKPGRLLVPILMLVISVTTFAQSRDFAGSWTLDVEKTGSKDGPPMAVITMTDKEMTARLGSATARLMTFKLDGTEVVLKEGGKTKAVWNKNKLEATVTRPEGVGETVTISREGAWLVFEAPTPQHGLQKLYFKKS